MSEQRQPHTFIQDWASQVSLGASIVLVVVAIITGLTGVLPFESGVWAVFASAGLTVLFASPTYGAMRWLRFNGVSNGVEAYTSGDIRSAVLLTSPLFFVAGGLSVVATITTIPASVAGFPMLTGFVLIAIPVVVRVQAWRASLESKEEEEEPLERL